MIEIERSFLAKKIPIGLEKCDFKEVTDYYFCSNEIPLKLRLRRIGEVSELTKKTVINNDFSKQKEETILVNEVEFNSLKKGDCLKVSKRRYYYSFEGKLFEVDVFTDDLKGFVLIEIEFKTETERNNFKAPSFCGEDVTNEEFIAGGFLAGKNYDDVKNFLKKFDYEKLFLLT